MFTSQVITSSERPPPPPFTLAGVTLGTDRSTTTLEIAVCILFVLCIYSISTYVSAIQNENMDYSVAHHNMKRAVGNEHVQLTLKVAYWILQLKKDLMLCDIFHCKKKVSVYIECSKCSHGCMYILVHMHEKKQKKDPLRQMLHRSATSH